jgi:DnaK suppressor protein
MEAVRPEQEVLERLRTRLLEWKRRLQYGVEAIRDRPSIDREGLPGPTDLAASGHSHFVLSRKHERKDSLLRKIESALGRMANGSFGKCDRCEQDIPTGRLEALPVTTLCVDCQEEEELALRRLSAVRS